jgi:hypothetical protein
MKMRLFVPSKAWQAAALIGLLAACNFPGSAQAVPTLPRVTASPASLPTATLAVPGILPHSLFFPSDQSGSRQVWRMENDGVTVSQVTQETSAVQAFDVSVLDGSVALVTNNQLYIVDSDGSNRRLMVDNAAANSEAGDFFYTQRISDPRFSPDGRYLAFGFDGLWIVDLSTNQAIHLLQNEVTDGDEGVSVGAFYAPIAWAPNSQQLLLSLGDSEGSTLAFLNPGSEELVASVESNTGLVCCQAAWAPDSGSVVVASPYTGLIESGLWRYDARTAASTRLIDVQADGLVQFAGWPLQLADGSLQYFFASAAEIPSGDIPLFMVRSDADGVSGRAQFRSEALGNISEALWAGEGSLALVVQTRPDGGTGGSVLLAYSDGRQLQLLLDAAYQLRWGP